jgi:anti-sigma regulatory factor (Ser/Thr protein kinase)/serine/threonine protein phosphatase PrpC
METRKSVIQDILRSGDIAEARRRARKVCEDIGFPPGDTDEIALVVSELAANALKHAGGGRMIFSHIRRNDTDGIQVGATDSGPGIVDVERAVMDGFTTAESLGYGLGTVNRLMDSLDIVSPVSDHGGTSVTCIRWVKNYMQSSLECPLDAGAATRAHPKMNVNGDAFFIKRWGESVLIAVIDGLGHGQFAYKASTVAHSYLEKHYDQPLQDICRGVGRACRSTRGVVMALARFDWVRRMVTIGSIGNIEIRVFENSVTPSIVTRRGIIGGVSPIPHITEFAWNEKAVMVMFSDGISTHWKWDDFSRFQKESANVLAQKMLFQLARESDDATIVVVKEKTGDGENHSL